MKENYSLTPFFELSSDLLCIAGFDGYFREINPALCELLGYTKEELLKEPVNSFIHPEDRDLTSKHRDNIRTGKPLLNFENRYITKDGKIIWLSWTSMPVTDQQLVYAIAKNITHFKKHEAERNLLLSEVTRANRRLKQLNYTTAHDLRSPVGNLLSIFSMMDTQHIKDPETLEFINLLEVASRNLKKTLDHYIDNLKNEESLRHNLVEVDLETVLHQLTDSLSSLLRDAKARITLDTGAYRSVHFRPDYMESIFLNLITNSIKYAHPDRDPEVTITTRFHEGQKVLVFTDNGQGFDLSKNKDKVFGLHQKFSDHPDSKGIGLYLVHNHMADMGGRISVESEPDRGTTFTLTFKEQP